MTFKPGKSGNPAGRLRGASDPLEYARKLISPHLHQLAEQTLAAALQGDARASTACIEIAAKALSNKKAISRKKVISRKKAHAA